MLEGLTLTAVLTAAGSSIVVPYINKILGPSADEIGLVIAERARLYRLQNTFRFFRRAQEMTTDAGFEPKQVNLKTLLPLIEGASLEDAPTLTDKWAALLTNAANPTSNSDIKPAYAEILRQLTPLEAQILDQLFAKADSMSPFTSGELRTELMYNPDGVRKARAMSIGLDLRTMRYMYKQDDVRNRQNLSILYEFDAIADNLLRQRLIVLANSPSPKEKASNEEPKIGKAYFSSLGFDFMLACIPPSKEE